MWTFLPWDTLYSTTYHNKFFLEVMCHDLNLIRNWVDCNFRNLDLYYHYCCRCDIQMSWGCCPIGFLCNRVGWSILCFLLYLEEKGQLLSFIPVYTVLYSFITISQLSKLLLQIGYHPIVYKCISHKAHFFLNLHFLILMLRDIFFAL